MDKRTADSELARLDPVYRIQELEDRLLTLSRQRHRELQRVAALEVERQLAHKPIRERFDAIIHDWLTTDMKRGERQASARLAGRLLEAAGWS